MRTTLTLSILFLAILTAQSCRNGTPEPTREDRQAAVVAALDSLVAELVAERPADTVAYTRRLQAYLDCPYFDAGGGDTWMITRSVPARDDKGVFAVVTTDLVVDPPERNDS